MRILLSLLLAFSSLCTFAQTFKSQTPVTLDKSGLELHTLTDKGNNFVCNVLMNKDSINILLHDISLRVSKSFSLARLKKEKFLGGFINDTKLFIYFDDNNDTSIHNWTIDLNVGTKDENLVNIDKKNEKIVSYISNNGHFVSITVNKTTNNLSINDFYSGKQYNSLQYHLTSQKWMELFKADTLVKKLPEIEYLNAQAITNLDAPSSRYKVYLEDGSVNFVINNQADITRILSFNLNNSKVNERIIRHCLCSTRKGYTSFLLFRDNSFLLKNRLYYTQVSADSLCVQICDFSTGKIIKTFTAKKNQAIWFKNTGIKEESAVSVDEIDTVNETRKTLKRMSENEVVIAAFENGNNIELTVGSCELMQSGGGGYYSGGQYAGGFNSPGGYVPATYVPGTFGTHWGFGKSEHRRFTTFKMQLDFLSNPVQGPADPSAVEKLTLYKEDIKTSRETENLFVLKGVICYSYYNKKKKAIEIVQL